jgi:hypothetical protein
LHLEMKTLIEIWKKLLNEAGIPVSNIIDELRKNLTLIREEDKPPRLGDLIGCPVVQFDIAALHIE